MHKMIQTTQLIFQSRVHNNLLTDCTSLVGIDVPPDALSPHFKRLYVLSMLVLAICGYIKLEPGSVNINKGLLTRLPAAQWVSFHPDLRPAVPTQVIHCCEVILKWQTTSLNDITILCNIWVMLKNMYLIFVVSEHFQSLPAHHYTHSHWKMDTKT